MFNSNFRSLSLLFLGLVGLITLSVVGRELFGSNDAGYYQIRQTAWTGKLDVIASPGVYVKNFAKVTTYQLSDMHYFSKHNIDGGAGVESDPVLVQFTDGGKAEISGSIKFRLPSNSEKQLRLHNDYKTYENVKHDLVRQTVAAALMQTASLMKAEEIYTTRRGEFIALTEDQIKNGLYSTETSEVVYTDSEGTSRKERVVRVIRDSNGHPLIKNESAFQTYGIEVLQFTVKEIDFDKTIDALIAKKKETEQQKVVAIAAAEKAKQDAITAREQGNASIAQEKATQEVEKIKQVTIAQKEYEVAQLRRKQAEQDAAAAITNGKALAEVNRLKVQAGLTPEQRAQFAKDTAVGVAHELSQVQFPSMMVIGGGSGGAPTDPFAAVGLESLMRISHKLSSEKNAKDSE